MNNVNTVSSERQKFWQFVKLSSGDAVVAEEDQAVEYVRRNCNRDVFKKFMRGIAAGLDRVRKHDKEVINITGCFYLTGACNTPKGVRKLVTMSIEMQSQERSGGLAYSLELLVDDDGLIVDVNLDRVF